MTRTGEQFSGDTEPPGREASFVPLKNQAQGGSVWAIDGAPEQASVDRFAAIIPASNVDSTRFAIPPSYAAEASPVSFGPVAALPKGFIAEPGSGYGPGNFPLRVRCEQDDSLMAFVPAGGFIQGKNGAEANAGPQHGPFLDAFYIDVYEVTYEKFERYREASRAAKKPVLESARKPTDRAEPVTGVAWSEAKGYATWAGKELPTEAEWEKAARGPEGFDFPWGNGPYLWQRPRVPGQLDRVGSFPGDVSPFGVFDLAGNAREWCSDLYSDKYYVQLVRESGEAPHNPSGPRSSSGSSERVVKGGDAKWRVWARNGPVGSCASPRRTSSTIRWSG